MQPAPARGAFPASVERRAADCARGATAARPWRSRASRSSASALRTPHATTTRTSTRGPAPAAPSWRMRSLPRGRRGNNIVSVPTSAARARTPTPHQQRRWRCRAPFTEPHTARARKNWARRRSRRAGTTARARWRAVALPARAHARATRWQRAAAHRSVFCTARSVARLQSRTHRVHVRGAAMKAVRCRRRVRRARRAARAASTARTERRCKSAPVIVLQFSRESARTRTRLRPRADAERGRAAIAAARAALSAATGSTTTTITAARVRQRCAPQPRSQPGAKPR